MIGSFDRIGYRRHARGFVAADLDVDMSGRVCLVTGANAGLGRATSEALAVRGATVHMLCRDAGRGEAARDEIRKATGNPRVELAVVDISDLAAVRRYVQEAGFARVDVLVHNAGMLPATRILNSDGLEATFATHVAGPHLLTRLLDGPLRSSADARVVFVSSGGMYAQRLSFEDLDWEQRPYDGVRAYAQTKRMQVILASMWADAFSGSTVSVYAMHPGWADTGGVKTSLPRFYSITRSILRTPAEGADTTVWLAVKRPAPPPGGLWFDRKQRSSHYFPWTMEENQDRQRLWQLCQTVTGHEGGSQ